MSAWVKKGGELLGALAIGSLLFALPAAVWTGSHTMWILSGIDVGLLYVGFWIWRAGGAA